MESIICHYVTQSYQSRCAMEGMHVPVCFTDGTSENKDTNLSLQGSPIETRRS